MKIKTIGATVVTIALLTGCASQPHKGPAYGHERQFHQQIAESVPVKTWGYSIRDIRFSEDYRKALVVFLTPSKTQRDVVLSDDGFRRYTGSVLDIERQRSSQPGEPLAWNAFITVTLPSR